MKAERKGQDRNVAFSKVEVFRALNFVVIKLGTLAFIITQIHLTQTCVWGQNCSWSGVPGVAQVPACDPGFVPFPCSQGGRISDFQLLFFVGVIDGKVF